MEPWKHAHTYSIAAHELTISVFRCHMRHRCSCDSELRVTHGPGFVCLEQSAPHTIHSHDEHTRHRLRPEVEDKIRKAVNTDFTMSGLALLRIKASCIC